jgi:hypothetical protein
VRALDGTVFDNSHQRHGHGDNERRTLAADRAGLLGPFSRSGSLAGQRELAALIALRHDRHRLPDGINALNAHPPQRNSADLGGAFSAYSAFSASFFSASVAGKPLHAPSSGLFYSDDELKRPQGGLSRLSRISRMVSRTARGLTTLTTLTLTF